ncbi:MAG TPA: ATP-binding protein [Kofleriaceae bacterium]|nr:ATP-binding protein [Kofleriaceae bacterium]
MNVLAISSLLASLVILAIGASVLLRDRTRRTYTSFAAFTFMVSAWHLCNFIAMATREPLVEWLALWPAATIPPVALRFFREFLAEPSIGGVRRPPRVSLVWTIAAYLALLYSAVFGPVHNRLMFQVPFAAYVYGSLYRCVYELYLQYRHTAGRVARTRIRYLMLGGLVAITLAMTDSLDRFGVAWPTLGNVLSILYLYFLSQTLFRFRLLDVHELVGKMVVLGTLVVLLWATYGLLLAWVGGGQEGLFLLNAVVASFVILILFEPVRSRLENTINRWLVRQQSELRGRIDDVRRDLQASVDVSDMVRRIMTAVEESRRLTHASIYLLDSEGTGHDLAGHYGPTRPLERLDAGTHRRFLERLRAGYLDLETIQRDRAATAGRTSDPDTRAQAEALDDVAQTMEAMHASLVVPVFGNAETEQGAWLLGMIALRDERVEGFDLDDIDVFRRLATQVAATIEKTQVYERVKERDRLAAIGEMAAGLAHEIRNPLGAIKGAAQLLVGPDGKPVELTAESAEFLHIIVEEVNRLNNVLSQFLDYARPSRSDPSQQGEVDVNEVVRKTVQLIETYEAASRVRIDVRLDELLPPVAGDAEQLRQVFLNLGLNAIQAMEAGGTLEIVTSRRRRSRLGYGSFAEIRFRDSGVGIPRDKLKNLFIPFYTTKVRGTGLGLAISQRIVTQHSGTIEVRSSPGKGSTFSVFLPALGPSLPSREDDPHAATTQKLTGFRAPSREEAPAQAARAAADDGGATGPAEPAAAGVQTAAAAGDKGGA